MSNTSGEKEPSKIERNYPKTQSFRKQITVTYKRSNKKEKVIEVEVRRPAKFSK